MSPLSLPVTPRRRENLCRVACRRPTTPWYVSPPMSLVSGLDLEGSRTVASSTPVMIFGFLLPASRAPHPWILSGFGWRTTEVKFKPEVIPDDEHELVIERVCAIDLAKASGKVCVRLPGRSGRRTSKVWDVTATTGAVSELAADLVGERIERMTVKTSR